MELHSGRIFFIYTLVDFDDDGAQSRYVEVDFLIVWNVADVALKVALVGVSEWNADNDPDAKSSSTSKKIRSGRTDRPLV